MSEEDLQRLGSPRHRSHSHGDVSDVDVDDDYLHDDNALVRNTRDSEDLIINVLDEEFGQNVRAEEQRKAFVLKNIHATIKGRKTVPTPMDLSSASINGVATVDVPDSPRKSAENDDSFQPITRKHSFQEKKKNLKLPLHEDNDTIRRKNREMSKVGDGPRSFKNAGEEEEHDVETADLFNDIPDPYYKSENYRKLHISECEEAITEEEIIACKIIKQCIELRKKWQSYSKYTQMEQSQLFGIDRKNNVKKSSTDSTREVKDGKSPPSPKPKFRRRVDPEYDIFAVPIPSSAAHLYTYEMQKGVMQVWRTSDNANPFGALTQTPSREPSDSLHHLSLSPMTSITSDDNDDADHRAFSFHPHQSCFNVPSFKQFVKDLYFIKKTAFTGGVATFTYNRLELLNAKFHLHGLLNGDIETTSQKAVPHRDFYNVRKVDTHVHHSACMNQKHLLRFIKKKLKSYPEEVVAFVMAGI